MKLNEYASYDAVGLSELVRKGEITASELSTVANRAIDKLNPKLNFMTDRIPMDQVVFSAPENQGVLQGVPFLVKGGNADIKGRPYEQASRYRFNLTPEENCEYVTRIRQAGASILGQTTMPEVTMSTVTESVYHGPTRSPWNLNHTPGGSSGGSASAVASGAVPIAHAGDGGGSTRIPAACSGLVGLKPTRARTPIDHSSIFCFGAHSVVSRTVRDSAVALDALEGEEVGALYRVAPPARPYSDEVSIAPRPLKIGFTTVSPAGEPVHSDCVKAVHEAAKMCEAMGHSVEEKPIAYDWEIMFNAMTDIFCYPCTIGAEELEARTGVKAGPGNFEARTLAMLAHCKQLTIADFTRHLRELAAICHQVGHYFTQYDVFISPVVNQPPLPIGQLNGDEPGITVQRWFEQIFSEFASFTPIFNATGQPAISLPLYHSDMGLPIGVQFAAPHGDDATLFQLAGQLEQAMPWKDRTPDISIF